MSANDNRLGPTGDQSWYVHNNRLSEHSSVEHGPDGTVGRLPHLLKFELLNTVFVWVNSSAFDTDFVFENCLGAVDGDLVISFVSVFNRQIVVIGFQINVGVDVFLLNPSPNNSCHFVTVDVNYLFGNLNFLEGGGERALLEHFY